MAGLELDGLGLEGVRGSSGLWGTGVQRYCTYEVRGRWWTEVGARCGRGGGGCRICVWLVAWGGGEGA